LSTLATQLGNFLYSTVVRPCWWWTWNRAATNPRISAQSHPT